MRRVGVGDDAAPAERQRQRLDDAAGDVVLQAEQIAERRLHGVRREQRAARRLDQLRRGPQLIARRAAACP